MARFVFIAYSRCTNRVSDCPIFTGLQALDECVNITRPDLLTAGSERIIGLTYADFAPEAV